MANAFKIGKRLVGGENPCFIIAEIGINHNGKLDMAKQLIDAAADAGCDAVKLQTFKAKKLFHRDAGYVEFNKSRYRIAEVNAKYEMPLSWVPTLQAHARKRNIDIFSSVCDEDSATLLSKYDLSAYKLTSTAITHLPLQRHVASLGKPIIFSTGASDIGEVHEAYTNIRTKTDKVAMLHCIVAYPQDQKDSNLAVIETLGRCFPEAVIGFSDHTIDPVMVPAAAVTAGAKLLEKHITLNKKLEGPDHFFALEPDDLKKMVAAVRRTERNIQDGMDIPVPPVLMGSGEKKVYRIEEYSKRFSNRWIYASKDIKKGERLTKAKLTVLRPGQMKSGLHPRHYELLVNNGYRVIKDVKAFSPLTWDCLMLR